MSLLTKVGSFSKISGTGAQAITGLGFQPKAIIFWTSQSNPATAASGTWTPGFSALFGMTTGPTNSYCVQATADDNIAMASSARRMSAKAISATNNLSSNQRFEADLQSFDADGFTLNWTANAGAGTDVIMYMALGGTDITNAKVVNWTTGTATGNKAVTGVGFKPDLVFHVNDESASAVPTSELHAIFGLGVMNKYGQQWANGFGSLSSANPSNTSRFQQTDACIADTIWSETNRTQAHFVSMDADGFTVNFSTNTVGSSLQMFSLCLKGVSSKIGAFAKTTAAAPAAQSVTRCGFTPKVVMLSSLGDTARSGPSAYATWALGAYDGVTQRVAALIDVDAVTPTKVKSVFSNTQAYIVENTTGSGTTGEAGSGTSLDADGFSLSFNPNGGSANEILYLALGDAGKDTFPSTVIVA